MDDDHLHARIGALVVAEVVAAPIATVLCDDAIVLHDFYVDGRVCVYLRLCFCSFRLHTVTTKVLVKP